MKVIYEDNHIIIVEKPFNIPVQADSSKDKDLLNMVKAYVKKKYDKPGEVFIGLVHRLDRPVGGVMVFARTSKGASRLSEQVRNRSFKKTYLAVIEGSMEKKTGLLKDYLLKDNNKNVVKITEADVEGSKQAILEYEVLQERGNISLVKVDLKTGRPHQVRVQFSSRGCPLFGDVKYGAKNKADKIALWSYELGIAHPTTKEELKFKIAPPKEKPWNLFRVKL